MMSAWSCEPILDSYLLVVLTIGALVALWVFVRPSLPQSSSRSRILLLLRALLIVLLLIAMLRPTYVSRQTRPQSATLLLLIDQSRSMAVKDGAAGRSRWQDLADITRRTKSSLAELSEVLEVHAYGFDGKLREQWFEQQAIKLPSQPKGEETDFAGAMHDAIQKEAGKRLAGVILLSDGAQRAYSPQFDAQQIARELARTRTPLFTVPFGKPREQSQARDVAVERLQDQYTVFVKNQLQIRGALRVNGYVNQKLPVRLVIEGPAGVERRVLGPLELAATQDDELVNFEFEFAPEVAGAYRLRVEAVPQEGELVVANNEMTAYLNVLEGGLRVLYLDSNLLGHEQSFLRRSLAASPDIELDFRPIDPRLRDQWPIDLQATWDKTAYDVTIIGDVPAAALGQPNCQYIARQVESGRGLLMLGGINTFGPGGYYSNAISELLPMKVTDFQRQEFGADQPVRQDQHIRGPLEMKPSRPHFVTHLADRDANDAAWARLKPLLGANRISPLTPQAVRLAESQNGDPLLVARPYGTGRVLVFAGDSTYLWWLSGQQDLHRRFWRQVILWLASRDELLRRDVWVNLPRRRFRPGEIIRLSAGARAENGDVLPDAELSATVQLGDEAPREIRLVPEGSDVAGQIESLSTPGEYKVVVTAKVAGSDVGTAEASFQLAKLDLELADPAANPQALAMLADVTAEAGGRTVLPEQLPALLDDLRSKPPELEIEFESKTRFGDSPATTWAYFLSFIAILTSEWYLKKKWGLS